MERQVLLYVVYGPEEQKYFDHLKEHLSLFIRSKEVEMWGRDQVAPGSETDKEIRARLDNADIFLVLLTPQVIASDASLQEMMIAYTISQQKKKPIYHLTMQPVEYRRSFIEQIRPLVPDNKTVMEHANTERPLAEAAGRIRRLAEDIRAGKDLFDDAPQPIAPSDIAEEIESRPTLLGFAIDMSSSAIYNLRSQNAGKESGGNAMTLLMEAARSIHETQKQDPESLRRLQTSLFLYGFGLKLRPMIDVFTCINVAQKLITSETIKGYQDQYSRSALKEVLDSLSGLMTIDHRRTIRKAEDMIIKGRAAQKLVEDYSDQIITEAEQSPPTTFTLEDFWEQVEEHSGIRLDHATHFVGGRKPSLSVVFAPLIKRFQQELSQAGNNSRALLFFVSDGEFSSYQFAPFKKQLEDLGVTIIACYLSNRNLTYNYHILHGTAKDYWTEEAQELWKLASPVNISEKELQLLARHGWHIEENAHLFLQVNNSDMLEDLLRVLLQER